MPYRVILNQALVIENECEIPIPLSHCMDTKAQALEFMFARKHLSEDFRNAKVIDEIIFKALNGWRS